MPRPTKHIDLEKVELLASYGCTMEEIASELGLSSKTLQRNAIDAWQRGRDRLKMSLRRQQVKLAMEGDRGMLIWLGKQLLDQRDQQAVEVDDKRLLMVESPKMPETADEWVALTKPH